ncbi:MAG: hypothetical protein GY832_37890, partial [Chloroflexi bacterium]|nr:hypothetical protein [Chloroflexota bacterium]
MNLYESPQYHTFYGGLGQWQKDFINPQIEGQSFRPGKKAGVRVPSDKPYFLHTVADYGASGLDMECELTRYATAEQDVGHSSKAITIETRDLVEARILAVRPPGLWYSTSGGAAGRHFRLPLPAIGASYTERRHNNRLNAMRVITFLDDQIDKALFIAKPMNKASWTKCCAACRGSVGLGLEGRLGRGE